MSFEPGDEDESVVEAVIGPGDDGFELAATGSLPASLNAGQPARIRMLQSQAFSDSTRARYRREWGRVVEFCRAVGAEFLLSQPLTIAAYLEAAAAEGKDDASTPYASNTFNGWLAGIDKMHQLAALPKPSDTAEVEATMESLHRTDGGQLRRMPALLLEELRYPVAAIDIGKYPRAVHGVRD